MWQSGIRPLSACPSARRGLVWLLHQQHQISPAQSATWPGCPIACLHPDKSQWLCSSSLQPPAISLQSSGVISGRVRAALHAMHLSEWLMPQIPGGTRQQSTMLLQIALPITVQIAAMRFICTVPLVQVPWSHPIPCLQ